MPLGEVERVPFWYVVEDVSSTVTFWPADVVTVKPDVERLLTVPDAPPAAGPDRALDPPPPDPIPPAGPLPGTDCPGVEVGGVAVADEDATRPTDSPITEQIRATATIQALFLFDSSRRSVGQRACPALDAAVARSGGGNCGEVGREARPLTACSATSCSDVALDTGSTGRVSSGCGDWSSLMVALL